MASFNNKHNYYNNNSNHENRHYAKLDNKHQL